MPKQLSCYDVTPMDICGFAVQAETDAEVLEHLTERGKLRHGLTVEDLTPEMMSLVHSRVREVPVRKPPRFNFSPRATPSLLCCDDVTVGECVFVIQCDDLEEILEHVQVHTGERHDTGQATSMGELMALARGRIRAVREASR